MCARKIKNEKIIGLLVCRYLAIVGENKIASKAAAEMLFV
jgi:hypothetical protein